VLTRQPAPALHLVVAALLIGALAAGWPSGRVWRRVRILVTIVHEGGHALVAVLFGRRLTAIRLDARSGGVTETWGRQRGLGVRLTAFAGYPFPALAAAVLLRATVSGWSRAAAAAIAVVLLVMLLFARNTRGVLVLALTTAAMAASALWLPNRLLVILVSLLSGLWLAGAARTLMEERRARRHGAATDVSALAQRGVLPGALWWLAMWLPVGYAGWVTLTQFVAGPTAGR